MSLLRSLLLSVLFATAALAQTDSLEWAKGPEQWLMTSEEKRAWKDVKTVPQAEDFIDLFWARRDPTPGTLVNEFRLEVERRVAFADKNFKEGRKRGSLTERGRVLVVLGFPKNMGAELAKKTSMFAGGDGPNPQDPTGGRALAARDVWEYEYEDAQKYGVPKIEVVFLHDGFGDTVRRDPQRTDFSAVLPAAIRYPIVNDLKSVPEWGRRITSSPVVPEPTSSVPAVESTVPSPPVVSQSALAAVARPAGAGRFTLVNDAFAIQPQSGRDPFAALQNVEQFTRDQELGWAAEYCTGNAATTLDLVNVTLKISGMINGEKINFTTPAEELAPDSIKASPGCYLVRGAIPLSEMDPGLYDMTVTLADPSGGQSYNLSRQFKVE